MALTAKLHVDNKSYNVLECEYEFTQMVDKSGRPIDRPRGGIINIILASPGDSDLTLHEWMRDKNTTKNGKISLKVNMNNVDVPKTILFEDAYCVRLYEHFNSTNTLQMFMKISILAGTITFGADCEFAMIDK
jgi:hypothetical protein